MQVNDGRQIGESFASGNVGDVSEPDLVERLGLKVLFQKVRCDRVIVIRVGRRNSEFGSAICGDTRLLHALGDRAATTNNAALTELSVHPRTAIGIVMLLAVNRFDRLGDHHLFYFGGRTRTTCELAVRRCRDPQNATHHRDRPKGRRTAISAVFLREERRRFF